MGRIKCENCGCSTYISKEQLKVYYLVDSLIDMINDDKWLLEVPHLQNVFMKLKEKLDGKK